MFHGRKLPRHPAGKRYKLKNVSFSRGVLPPFGNWDQQWVAVANIATSKIWYRTGTAGVSCLLSARFSLLLTSYYHPRQKYSPCLALNIGAILFCHPKAILVIILPMNNASYQALFQEALCSSGYPSLNIKIAGALSRAHTKSGFRDVELTSSCMTKRKRCFVLWECSSYCHCLPGGRSHHCTTTFRIAHQVDMDTFTRSCPPF